MKKILLATFALQLLAVGSRAQCDVGEVSLTMNIFVDSWGEETYWELTPAGTGCGNQTVAYGSNDVEVGCGLGLPITGNYGYPDNTMISEGPFCLTLGESYDLYFYDGFGDGGLVFEIYQDGQLTQLFFGQGAGNMTTFTAGEINAPAYDVPCGALEVVPDGPAVTLNNQQAIANYNEIHPGGSNCSIFGQWCETGATNSVWAYFVASANKNYEVSLCNEGTSFDTQIAVWKGDDCGVLQNFELISANDDQFYGCGEGAYYASTCYAGCLEAGEIYYIQVDGYYGETGTAVLTVTTYDGDVFLEALAGDGACPVGKGEQSSGSVQPWIWGMGSNFTCQWTGPDGYFSTAHDVYNLSPGVYNLVATDPCGQTYTAQYEVFDPAPWNVSMNLYNATCQGSADGEIEVFASGATGPYTYYCAGPGNFTSDQNPVSGLIVGDYTMVVIDNNGCQFAQELFVDSEDAFTFDLGPDTTLCLGDQLLIYGPPGLTYLWQDGSTNQFFLIDADAWGVGNQALILTAYTSDGCVHTEPFIFMVESCTGVDSHSTSPLQVYPNPSQGTITVSAPGTGTAELHLMDMMGRLVYSQQVNLGTPQEIQLSVATGTYVLQLVTDASKVSVPLLIR